MIGKTKTGHLQSCSISAASHTYLEAATNTGEPAFLAIVDRDGNIIESGESVAREAHAVAISSYQRFLRGEGYLRTVSSPDGRNFDLKAA